MSEFQVRRDALDITRIVPARLDAHTPLDEGEVLARVDLFSFTANNLTYGQVGDQLGYWQFFPTGDPDWGIIPVWGFADVVASRCEGIEPGERLYGYFPPAGFVRMRPGKVGCAHLLDASAHRRRLPAGYNTYMRVDAEPGRDPADDPWRALLQPLLVTSFCLWDALSEAGFHAAERIVILSASSKTALGLAHALSEDPAAPPVIGITSPRHVETLRGLSLYAEVMEYDALATLDPQPATVIVDMAGNGAVLGALHARLGEAMRATIQVGVTHRAEVRDPRIVTARSGFFFAPSHIETRMAQWGPAGFAERSGAVIAAATRHFAGWMALREVAGVEGLAAIYPQVAAGTLPMRDGVIVRM